MVTDVTESTAEEQADQVPSDPVQTEVEAEAPQLSFPDAAAPAEEAAVTATEPEEPPLTRAEIEAMLRERETVAEQRAAERLRRDRQREEGRRSAEATRNAQEKAELAEVLGVELYKRGLAETNPEELMPILDRYASKREVHYTNRTLQDVAQAFEYAAAETLGMESDLDLTPKAEEYARSLAPFVRSVAQRTIDGIIESGEYIPKAELAKHVDAEIERRNAKAREGKTQLPRVDGAPSPASRVMSWDAYQALPDQEKMAMSATQRAEIMAADRKARGL